jgi:N-hydroxyarylamine O-acetyltransferase
MDTAAYLARIGFDDDVRHDRETLEALQRAHLTEVPFENLDVFHRRGVRTEPAWSISKIVDRRRGGWCYELNGAFHALLVALGFDARLLGATVLPDHRIGRPRPNHAVIEVMLDRSYLVDVGFGDSFIRPLALDTDGPSDGGTGQYRFVAGSEIVLQEFEAGSWVDQYRFDRRQRRHDEFDPSSDFLQRDGSGWTDKPFATRLLDRGPDRVRLLSDRIKFRRDGKWEETPVAPEAWAGELERWFGMAP